MYLTNYLEIGTKFFEILPIRFIKSAQLFTINIEYSPHLTIF